ncbi:MAG: hypothetical protein AAF293_12125 [Pseudomonadota bacterium]
MTALRLGAIRWFASSGTMLAPMQRVVSMCLATAIVVGAVTPTASQTNGAATPIDVGSYRAPSEGGVRRWQVTPVDGTELLRSASQSAIAVSKLSTGDVLSNMGCAQVSGRIWCDVRPFRGGARGVVPFEHLRPAIGPDGVVPIGIDHSKKRARKRDFDATGTIRCAQEAGQSLGGCKAGVARGSGGDATIAVTFPNGFVRQLYFEHGEFISASATMSGVGRDTDWELREETHLIRVDDQRFELPDVLVFGE